METGDGNGSGDGNFIWEEVVRQGCGFNGGDEKGNGRVRLTQQGCGPVGNVLGDGNIYWLINAGGGAWD